MYVCMYVRPKGVSARSEDSCLGHGGAFDCFANSAAIFSTSSLVLQKQHSFKHKRRFSQVYKHQNQIKTIYMQILHYDTYFNIADRNLSHL